ncbi:MULTISPECIES: hypothetical protein [unclassified Thiomonas]|uniref:hypothetical protein n=1 Tax=unclassified Thiomonas TaxID=2625466 RepID=UPI0015629FC5|nr:MULTISPECIES: hypothetical protein [unclassified Thiomonas]MDD5001569.1 hypothetical protein [Thiomonas arsenitoxydans]
MDQTGPGNRRGQSNGRAENDPAIFHDVNRLWVRVPGLTDKPAAPDGSIRPEELRAGRSTLARMLQRKTDAVLNQFMLIQSF